MARSKNRGNRKESQSELVAAEWREHEIAAAISAGIAAADRGELIAHEHVERWLRSW